MELTATLSKEQWDYVLEVLNQHNSVQIKGIAIGLIKPQLDQQFEEKIKK